MRTIVFSGSCLFSVLTACATSPSTSEFTDQIAVVGNATSGGMNIDLAEDFTGACSAYTWGGIHRKNVNYVRIELNGYRGQLGTFNFSTSGGGDGNYAYEELTNDTTCEFTHPTREATGTLTLTRVTATEVEGTYDMTFPDRHRTGNFKAAVCNPCDPQASACPDLSCR